MTEQEKKCIDAVKDFADDFLKKIDKSFQDRDMYFFDGLLSAPSNEVDKKTARTMLDEIAEPDRIFREETDEMIKKEGVEYFLQLPRITQDILQINRKERWEHLLHKYLRANSWYCRHGNVGHYIKDNMYVWAIAYLACRLKPLREYYEA